MEIVDKKRVSPINQNLKLNIILVNTGAWGEIRLRIVWTFWMRWNTFWIFKIMHVLLGTNGYCHKYLVNWEMAFEVGLHMLDLE